MNKNAEKHPKLTQDIKDKVTEVIARSDVNADASAIKPITEAVINEVAPRIDHLTGNVNPLQSQVFWGVVLLIATRLLAQWGYTIPEEYHGQVLTFLVTYGPYAAAAVIVWGRWIAKRPLFSKWFS